MREALYADHPIRARHSVAQASRKSFAEKPPVQESIIKLRQLENSASNKSTPDLFKDDNYLAYNEQLIKSDHEIAVQTNNQRGVEVFGRDAL